MEGNWANIVHKEQGLILLPAIIELYIYLEDGEAMFEKINEICTASPVLFTHACRILIANQCHNGPLALFEEVSFLV